MELHAPCNQSRCDVALPSMLGSQPVVVGEAPPGSASVSFFWERVMRAVYEYYNGVSRVGCWREINGTESPCR